MRIVAPTPKKKIKRKLILRFFLLAMQQPISVVGEGGGGGGGGGGSGRFELITFVISNKLSTNYLLHVITKDLCSC